MAPARVALVPAPSAATRCDPRCAQRPLRIGLSKEFQLGGVLILESYSAANHQNSLEYSSGIWNIGSNDLRGTL